MKYEGVNFNELAIRQMTEEEFVKMHLGAFWPDRDDETRRKMLAEVHRLSKPKREKKKSSDEE